MLFVNICNFVSGAAPLCRFISFIHASWVAVEPNATELPSESLYQLSADHPRNYKV